MHMYISINMCIYIYIYIYIHTYILHSGSPWTYRATLCLEIGGERTNECCAMLRYALLCFAML